ncbi:hypothetical protein [Pseudomonas sp. efr-133-TYG-5]|uniref:hypothetical protein n=1 Tax=Pseudomonas sp. efr-133-TYG-5 TaxID=3040310 RepID=UPI0025565608|nr:hypothetical protein [Pseudomonas sp. efr-133-TYG-5]
MVQPTKTTSTTQTAKNAGTSGKTTKTHQIVVSGAYMEVLIGGPYKWEGVDHPYGHAALHVVVGGKDITYDFGRYGLTWGPFDSEGEGLLNVWTSFRGYIANENRYGRTTTGFVYYLDNKSAEAVIAHFAEIIAARKQLREKFPTSTRYLLQKDYHPTTNNCTTMTMEGAKVSGKSIVQNPGQYAEMRGLSWVERQATRTQNLPKDGIFMPADFQAMLEGNTETRYDKKNVYKK